MGENLAEHASLLSVNQVGKIYASTLRTEHSLVRTRRVA